MDRPTIVAIGGGSCGVEPADRALDDYLLSLTGKEHPRVCHIPTASGDAAESLVRFYTAYTSDRCVPSHLALFWRTVRDIRSFLLSQDMIFVGGGNTAAMLAVWRQHGVDSILREAWERGIPLCGVSAGGNCWFQACSTDSFGPDLDPLDDGLGFLPGFFCPHYDGEERRRPTLRQFVAEGRLGDGWAADNHVALRFEGTDLLEAVSSKPTAGAYRVTRAPDGAFQESPVKPRLLPT